MAKQQITQQEYDFIVAELERLKKRDASITADLKHSLNIGSETWHDNDVYDTAKDQKQRITSDKILLERALKSSEIVKSLANPQRAEVGTLLELEDENGARMTVKLGGPLAARLGGQWVSSDSPLGSAALGAKTGATIRVDLPAGQKSFTVISLSAISI